MAKHMKTENELSPAQQALQTIEDTILIKSKKNETPIEEPIVEESAEDIQEKNNRSFSNKIVTACVIANILFTAAIFCVKVYDHSISIPDSLIVAWFGFWGAEIIALASIKKDKIKNKYHETK